MEDDIDIEEHDVLDNPAIKNMFPDLSVIKKEIQQYYEDTPQVDQNNAVQVKSELQTQGQFMTCIQSTSRVHKTEDIEIKEEITETDTNDTSEGEDNPNGIDTDNDSTISNLHFYSNKIILGSKPSNSHVVDEYEIFFEKQLTTIQPKVLVEDMQPYLERSGRYCTKCETLFPNISALDDHNKTTHSLIKQEDDQTTKTRKRFKNIVTLADKKIKCSLCQNTFGTRRSLQKHLQSIHDKSKCKIILPLLSNFKCHLCGTTFANKPNLLRHRKNKHKIVQVITPIKNDDTKKKRKIVRNPRRKITGQLSESDKINKIIKQVRHKMKTNKQSLLDESNRCFHCSTKFTSSQSLIEHLYQVLQSKMPESTQRTTEILHANENQQSQIAIITANVEDPKKEVRKSNSVSKKCLYYRCHVCSFYFKDTMSYVSHLAKNHKITTHIKLNNVPFDSKCEYCQKTMVNVSTYNLHLQQFHALHYKRLQKTDSHLKASQKVGNTNRSSKTESDSDSVDQLSSGQAGHFNSLVLKSTIFKCNKCDIYFLSAGTTMNHSDHMELLVNWKCTKCNRIFKKNDEKLHERQHKYSEKFNVLDLPDTDLVRVLYGCPKCTVHFNEDNFIKHFPTCGTEAPNSTYCKFCDLLIDDAIGKTHKLSHQNENLKSTDFPVIVTDVIHCYPKNLDECSSQKSELIKRKYVNTESDIKCSQRKTDVLSHQHEKFKDSSVVVTSKISRTQRYPNKEGSKVLKRKYYSDEEFDIKSTNKKSKSNRSYMFDMVYCTTCKCCITDSYTRNVHLQGNCGHLGKHICQSCGVVITTGTYRGHKGLHNQIKNLKLQDFRFYDLKSGKRISPPVPEFPKCVNCNVRFVSKMATKNHDCCGEDYLTCHICEMKLSEAAFKLHMLFHNYSNDTITQAMDSTSKELENTLNMQSKSKSQNSQKHKYTSNKSVTENEVKNNLVESKASVSKTSVAQITNKADPLAYHDVTTSINSLHKTNKIEPADREIKASDRTVVRASCQSADSTTDLIKDNIDVTMALLFTCMNCGVSVDSYDRAVEHSQQHFIQKEWDLEIGLCPICNFKLDKQCLANHQKLHNLFKYGDTNFFRELKFDAFYLTAKNDVWINHIFENLQQGEKDKILANSIYKYECKIKMDVIQDGPPDLTVYKCEKCRCFIDETSLSRHADNACFKLRRHPCTFCGLAFSSSLARIEHEKIHKRPNISAKSYRIVSFNREKDKTHNSALSCIQYVLYQCRNCNVTVDKSRKRDHKCCHNERQKCSDCGLLVNIDEYKFHQLRHKELNLCTQNMKIIMFGDKIDNSHNFDGLTPTYNGDIYDYTFYKCAQCHICDKNVNMKHSCSFGSSRIKCGSCDLFFMTGKFKHHRKFHVIDPDFTRENMRIITFNTSLQKIPSSKINNVIKINDLQMGKSNDSKADNDEQDIKKTVLNDVLQKTANIYKCKCGLCFFDETSALSHIESCNPRIRTAIQRCSKCDFVFSPNILFQHLLVHHGDKKLNYSFNVVDVDKLKDTNLIYKCSKCLLHFIKYKEATSHFRNCNGTESDAKLCSNCKLNFCFPSLTGHENNCVNEFKVKIIDEQILKEDTFPTQTPITGKDCKDVYL